MALSKDAMEKITALSEPTPWAWGDHVEVLRNGAWVEAIYLMRLGRISDCHRVSVRDEPKTIRVRTADIRAQDLK